MKASSQETINLTKRNELPPLLVKGQATVICHSSDDLGLFAMACR